MIQCVRSRMVLMDTYNGALIGCVHDTKCYSYG
jgi:hypothetical protein